MTTQDEFGSPGTGSDPFGSPAASREFSPAEARAAVPRDQWDRYLIPAADGTKPATNKGRLRATTLARIGHDGSILQDRAERLIVEGLAKSPALSAAAMKAAAMPDSDKGKRKALRLVAAAAFEAAGGNEKRDRGTLFHELTYALKLHRFADGPEVDVPEDMRPEVEAYFAALQKHGLQPIPELMERVVICPYDVGGCFDDIMRYWNPETEAYELVVVDSKTDAHELQYSRVPILIQLWEYANAYSMYVTEGIDYDDAGKIIGIRGYIEPMPLELRQDKAMVVRAPLDGSCEVLELDLSGVARYAAAAIELKRANNEAKFKYRSLGVVRPDAFVAPITVQAGTATVTFQPPAEPAAAIPVTVEDWHPDHPGRVAARAAQAAEFADPTEHISLTTQAGRPKSADQVAQETKAAERLAAAGAAVAGKVLNGPVKPPEPERDPVTGRKKRTCGFCHHPGHTQKNCPDNPESPKYVAPVQTELEQDTAELVQRAFQPRIPGADDTTPLTAEQEIAVYESTPPAPEQPYCTLPHVCEWTSQNPAAPGQWVCSVSGKPGKRAWEAGQTRVTTEAPFYGAPSGTPGIDINPPAIAEAQAQQLAQAGQPIPPAHWGATPAPDMVAWGITNAQTPEALLTHRNKCAAAGTWNETYEAQAAEKYSALIQGV